MGRFCDPKVDELLNKARTASTLADRKAAYEAAAPAILANGERDVSLPSARCSSRTGTGSRVFSVMPDGLIRVTGLRLK